MRETIMDQRINYSKVAPEGIRALGGLETYLRSSGLEPDLLNLIKTRASQLNGCAYCIDMHTKDARARGETEQRLYALPAWRATPFRTVPGTYQPKAPAPAATESRKGAMA